MASTVLPLYNTQRTSPVPRFRTSPSLPFRVREKYLILIGACLLLIICYSTFVFLPSEENKPYAVRQESGSIRKQVQDVFHRPERLVLPPPRWFGNKSIRHQVHDFDDSDPHRRADEEALRHKIDQAQIPAPDPNLEKLVEKKYGTPDGDRVEKKVVFGDDEENAKRRNKIREMMIFAWDGYVQYAWGSNELRPSSKVGHSASVFGSSALGATIIDALDTLYIMGLHDRFENGRKWVEMSFNMQDVRGDLSVFETNIRFVGGLLACYALTEDDLFKQKAKEVVDLLMPAFNSPTGIPYALINVKSKNAKNWGWASAGSSILSEFGSLHIEFEYLSEITGSPIYAQKVHRIREVLNSLEKPGGLYPNYLNPKTGKWGTRHVSMGALGDSFYEYLLKSWLRTAKRDVEAKQMYDAAIQGFESQLIMRSKNGLTYFAEMKGSRVEHKMDHLACFSAGMLGLQAWHERNDTTRAHYMQLAKEIARTCHESYIRTDTGLGPESFRFTSDFEAKTVSEREKYYILRPEVIEGWFYLWRITKDPKYRQWAWDAALAIEKYCKSQVGYSGIRNVYTTSPVQDDVQQSFFLAETLKYLYLIFADDSVMALDQWVFNTEAHALPVVSTAPHQDNKITVDASVR